MSPFKKRLVDLAAGWGEDSDALVNLTPADAVALGVKVERSKPTTIKGRDLFARANALPDDYDPSGEPAEPTPVQQSVSPGPQAADPPARKK